MKKIIIVIAILAISCKPAFNLTSQKTSINNILDNWHAAAAQADFDTYFSLMTPNGVFIGTDPTENWQNQAFRDFSKPFFDKGKAWNFKPLQRNIYFSDDHKTAWFDELLDTQMKLCRGSGTLQKTNNQWKIAHYVLSMTVPNDNTKEVIKIKATFDDNLKKKLFEQK